jgi:hypothetical protein
MKKLLLPIVFFVCVGLHAQEIDTLYQSVVSNAGETLTDSSNYTLTFTLGEFAIEKFDSDGVLLTQGFHQPKLVVSSVDGPSAFGEEISIFPNPARADINIKFQFPEIEAISLSVFDVEGKRLQTAEYHLATSSVVIDVRTYPSGHYFLEISNPKKGKQQTFKIIKQ